MLGRLLTAITILAIVVAGCVTPAADLAPADAGAAGDISGARLPPPDVDLSKVIVSDHGAPYLHAVPDLHKGAYRVEKVGYNPLTGPEAGPAALLQNSNYIAVTLHDDKYACVAGFAGTGGVGGATIVDIVDPAKPKVLSTITNTLIVSRCEFTPDGKFLLVGAYLGQHDGVEQLGGLGNAGAYGVSIYDVKDPKSPKFLAHDVAGAGREGDGPDAYHNFAITNRDGVNYVYQTYTGNILRMAEDGKSLKVVGKLEHANHDFWIGPHPITGAPLLVTGAGRGTAFFDLADPELPVLLGVWEGSVEYQGWHRQFPLAQTVGGKAIMVVAGETCGDGRTLPYTMLDFTDTQDIKQLGSWQVPGKPEIKEPGQVCSMSAHEFTTWNGYVATGNYHAGMWVFDVGTPERLLEPVTIGYYLPDMVPQQNGGTKNTPFAWSPDVWGAYFDSRGYIHFADWSSGYYVVKVPGMVDATA